MEHRPPLGNFYEAKALSTKTFESLTDFYFSDNTYKKGETCMSAFTEEDYYEVKRAIIDEIKANPQDWKLEKERKMIILKHKFGRKHYKEGFIDKGRDKFSDEGWREIETALSNQQQEQTQVSQGGDSGDGKGGFSNPYIWGSITIISLIGLVFTKYLKKSKRRGGVTSPLKMNEQKKEQN